MQKGKVYFIGAGPGDLELLTIKGKRLLESADVMIYADSLVNPAVESMVKPSASIHRSAALTLEQMADIMAQAARQGKLVARLHTGDPSLFSAVHEQRALLEKQGIDSEIVPGVSSVSAAAAALNAELTVPGISQTVILTRLEGRTPVPPAENLGDLARHQATMAIFLSTPYLASVVSQLVEGGYQPQTPVAIVARASRPDQNVFRGTLADIEARVSHEKLENPSIVLVGQALDPLLADKTGVLRSRLYDGSFEHGFRHNKP